ncbi:MAG: T9SS type A sorting domain-containing protein [Flavobacteriaceae bacterium]|nr:T9SS type A sorting domain-containing protein [Flavobacteriaceae bacterium]
MKKILLFCTFIISLNLFAQTTYVPDDNFEQALIDLGYDSGALDDYVPTSNISSITNLFIPSKGIADLTGIEDFTSLTFLNCASNNLSTVDISSNTALIYFSCSGNNLNSLDVSSNTALRTLVILNNQIASIDLSTNVLLERLFASNNLITSLDLSLQPNLELLGCENNLLTSLNVKNGNNTAIPNADFDATNNPNLPCIEVDDASWSTTNWTNIDATTSFNENCYTYVLDSNFEQALIDLGYDTVLDNYVLTSNIDTVTFLDVSSKGISDLTGIQGFVALTELRCSTNTLTSLDVSANTALITLWCNDNLLTSLDTSTNAALTHLVCNDNSLTNLDVSANVALVQLHCVNNSLTSLDLSTNTALTHLRCQDNSLTSLDILSNAALTVLMCHNNSLTSLDISANMALTRLRCFNNSLASLDVSTNTALTRLWCQGNSITSLDVSTNVALTSLWCFNNSLTSLDVSTNTALITLWCNDNSITSLDISTNTALTGFRSQDNQLTSLNLKNGNNTAIINANFDATNNPNLTCIEVDDASWSTTNWTNIDAQSTFRNNCSLTYVPDDNFEQALIDLGYDTVLDDYVYTEDINIITSLNVNGKSIADLTGIEDFVVLTSLWCQSNSLTSLDISANTALTDLRCFNNSLTSLDVSTNTALTRLWCQGNSLTSLDVSTNVALNSLHFYNNSLTDLDVSTNTALTELYCFNNPLTNLDVSVNTALTRLFCANNSLTSLDLSTNTALEWLNCRDNQLTSLDVSANTALTRLHCQNNQLTNLNLKNGNNTAIINADFDATNNPNLTCIEVDDVSWSTTNWTNIDAQSTFRNNCSLTYVPDDNFEQALIDLGYDTVLDDYVYTEDINTIINLDVSSKSIADLTGIEDFVALTSLWCQSNSLTSLDVLANTALIALSCQDNQLTSLDISANTALTFLNCQDNQLTSLDVSVNTGLTYLNCRYNELTSLDVSTNTALTELRCSNNELTNLEVSTNTALTFLTCNNNQLTSLDVSANPALTVLVCFDNQLTSLNVKNGNNTAITNANFYATNNPNLTCIEVDDAVWSTTNWTNIDTQATFRNTCSLTYVPDDNFEQALIDLGYDTVLDDYVYTEDINTVTLLDVSSKNIADLTGIEDFVALTELDCDNNSLTSLDISTNTALTRLDCFNNSLTSLDISTNIALDFLRCGFNQLTSLDVSANTALTILLFSNNQLTNLDISTNTNLTILNCSSNSLTSLDVSANTALTALRCQNNSLTNLDVSTNTALITLWCHNNLLTGLDVSINASLTNLWCPNNQLTSLNVKNGNNTAITNNWFNTVNNPSLTCIEVDDATWSTTNWTNIDPASSFSEDCNPETIWISGAWTNGVPTIIDNAIIRDNYSTTAQGASIDAFTLVIDPSYTLTIADGDYLQVENNITVNGNLIVQHQGSVVQIDDTATVTNNGNITVLKTMTSFDSGTDFAILGSPMTGETRNGVYSQNNVTMNHLTANFVPHTDVATNDPGAENFADDDGNNWAFLTGAAPITPGVGYLVGGITAGGNFTSTYTQGTLNNGIINYNTIFNTDQNASPNVMSNPYASAIDANIFINNNTIVDALYFWEHLTPPSTSYPGYRAENWDMGDISMYNLSGGIAAANGGSSPSQYIPSGQGFAIKANAFGTVIFDNSLRVVSPNIGYRNSENTNRMYVNVSNETYGLKGKTLITFTPNATDEIDVNYDAKRLATPISIYSKVEEQELSIQGRSAFNENQIIPLGFRTQVEELQEYTISLGLIEGTEISNATVYLQDNLLQTETNLSETSYSFTSEDGNFSDRFIIYFGQEVLGNNEVTSNTVSLYPNPVSSQVSISSIATISTVIIYDLSGRVVRSINANEQTNLTIDLSELSSAMYFVEIKTPRGSITKRIIKE